MRTMAVGTVVCFNMYNRYIIIISSHTALPQEDPLITPNEDLIQFGKINYPQILKYANGI